MTGAANSIPPASIMAETRAEVFASAPQSAMIVYTPWKLHTQVTLQRTQAPFIACHVDGPMRAVQLPVFTILPSGGIQATLYVERVLSRRVAVLADCNSASSARWAVKYYAFDWVSRWHLGKENAAYAACAKLQGKEVPLFYGQWGIVGTSGNACCAVMMEFVLPGTTIADLRDGMVALAAEELALAHCRLVRLQDAAVAAADRLQACRVLHLDLSAENMVVVAEEEGQEGVVLVGFARAMVEVVDGGWKMGDRWALFQMGFLERWDGVQPV